VSIMALPTTERTNLMHEWTHMRIRDHDVELADIVERMRAYSQRPASQIKR